LFFDADWAVLKIGWSLKPNHHREIELAAQIRETLCIYLLSLSHTSNARTPHPSLSNFFCFFNLQRFFSRIFCAKIRKTSKESRTSAEKK